jgi:hypothetical protein
MRSFFDYKTVKQNHQIFYFEIKRYLCCFFDYEHQEYNYEDK